MSAGEADAWIREGYAAQGRGDLLAARRAYERVLAADPAHADALYLLGEVCAGEGAWHEARSFFERAIRANPAVPQFHRALAVALFHTGEPWAGNDRLRLWLEARLAGGERGAYRPPADPPVTVGDTTLVCVDCRAYGLAIEALERTLAVCRFEEAIFFTDAAMEHPAFRTVPIAPIRSLEQYSTFMIKGLNEHIHTPFVLVTQYDGYVLDAGCWEEAFKHYDYVGAPWDDGGRLAVGNGGFSLRSKRLLEALQDPEIVECMPEDMAICLRYRQFLERKHGIQFAPPDVAGRFGFEALPPQGPTFGFHGIGHLAFLYGMSREEARAYRPPPLTRIEAGQ